MKKLLAILILMSVFITGCSKGSSYNSYMEQGKIAAVESNYDNAKEFFKLALEEKNNDVEAKALYEQVNTLIEAVKVKEARNFEEAIKLLSKIENTSSKTDAIKNKASKLKEECNQGLEKAKDIENTFYSVENLINEKKYSEAKKSLDKTIEVIESDGNLKNKLEKAKELLSTCNNNIEAKDKKKTEDENKKKEDIKKQSEKIEEKDIHKFYCSRGSHYVIKANYVEEQDSCKRCCTARDFSSTSTNQDCTKCGAESTVDIRSGTCARCDTKLFPGVKTIHEDGRVVFEDGSVKRYY